MSQVFKFGSDSNSQGSSIQSKSCDFQHLIAEQKLQNLFSQWGDKIDELESQIDDVKVMQYEVIKTLSKARRKPFQLAKEYPENKENISPKQYSSHKAMLNQQNSQENGYSFTYQYHKEQINEISLELTSVPKWNHLIFKQQNHMNESFIDVSLKSEGWWSQENILISKRPIGQFLLDAKVEDCINNFLDIAVYENQALLQHLKEDGCWNNLLLRKFGIDKAGHRKSIYIQLMEDCRFYERIGLLKYSQSFDQNELPSIEEWLQSISLQYLYSSFIQAGYDNFERLIVIQNSEVGFCNANHIIAELNLNNFEDGNTLFEQLTKMTKKVVGFNFVNYITKANNKSVAKPIMCSLNQVKNECILF